MAAMKTLKWTTNRQSLKAKRLFVANRLRIKHTPAWRR